MNKDVELFNKRAKSYESSWTQVIVFEPVHKKCIDTAIALNINPKVIVDLGCGTGKLIRQAGTVWSSAELIGVDPAPNMIEIARKSTDKATFCLGYPQELPFADKSADLIFSTMSFHHWNDHAKAVKEIGRVLTPNGYFILGDVTEPRWFTWLIREPKNWKASDRSILLEKAGFNVNFQEKCLFGFVLITLAQKAAPA